LDGSDLSVDVIFLTLIDGIGGEKEFSFGEIDLWTEYQ